MKPILMSFAILGRFGESFGAPLPLLDVRFSELVDERHLDLNSWRRGSLLSDLCFSEFPIDFLPHTQTLSLASWKGQRRNMESGNMEGNAQPGMAYKAKWIDSYFGPLQRNMAIHGYSKLGWTLTLSMLVVF